MKKALVNTKIYTGEDNVWAEMLIWNGETIDYVGKRNENLLIGIDQVYDLKGKVVTPGIIDSHTHPEAVSQSAWHVKFHGRRM